jgi:hypothetical protein
VFSLPRLVLKQLAFKRQLAGDWSDRRKE